MAYKRPLTTRQSYIIIVLWLIFAIVFVYKVPINLISLVVLTMSAFVVFYPIRKSRRERRTMPTKGKQRQPKVSRKPHKRAKSKRVYTLLLLGVLPYGSLGYKVLAQEGTTQTERKLHLGGYLQMQGQWGEADAKLRVGDRPNERGAYSRLGIRRGRLKVAYRDKGTEVIFQLDATERGVAIKDAYLKMRLPWEGWLRSHLQLGIFDRPFGSEIRYSSSERESPERSRIFNELFPGERDLGMMLSLQAPTKPALAHLKLEAGLFAGNGLNPESDSRKDLIVRLSSHRAISPHFAYTLGLSHYHGYVYQSTPNVYLRRTEGVGYQKLSHKQNQGSYAPRSYCGIDAVLSWQSPIGRTEFRGEYLWGVQSSPKESFRSPSNSRPAEGDTYVRHFAGGYAMLVQRLGKLPLSLVAKYDWLDPNRYWQGQDEAQNDITSTDLRYDTWGIGLVYNISPALRLTAYYDWVRNETTKGIAAYTHDRADNTFTLRLQYKF